MSRHAARLVLALLPLAILGCAGAPATGPVTAARVVSDPAASDATILHVLQRLTYGPRPGTSHPHDPTLPPGLDSARKISGPPRQAEPPVPAENGPDARRHEHRSEAYSGYAAARSAVPTKQMGRFQRAAGAFSAGCVRASQKPIDVAWREV